VRVDGRAATSGELVAERKGHESFYLHLFSGTEEGRVPRLLPEGSETLVTSGGRKEKDSTAWSRLGIGEA